MKKQKKPTTRISKTAKRESDKSPKVFQKDKIDYELNIYERTDLQPRQQELIDIIEDKNTKVVFVKGPAGTAKTFTAIYAALKLMNKKSISDIVYVRTIAESSSKSLGSLPGEVNDKMAPFLMPLTDKLEELLPKADVDFLVKSERIQGIPVNYLRGASINVKAVIVDEAQNLSTKELITTLTRIGKFSKFIILGDEFQSDIRDSGFIKMFDLFNDQSSRDQGIHSFAFTHEDIVRSGVLKFIVEKIEGKYTPPVKEPMFVGPVK